MGKTTADRVQQNRLEHETLEFFYICKYVDMYVNKLRTRIKNEFWDHFLQAVKHSYQTYSNGRIDPNWDGPYLVQ